MCLCVCAVVMTNLCSLSVAEMNELSIAIFRTKPRSKSSWSLESWIRYRVAQKRFYQDDDDGVDAEALKNAYEAIKQKEEAKMSSAQRHSGNLAISSTSLFPFQPASCM